MAHGAQLVDWRGSTPKRPINSKEKMRVGSEMQTYIRTDNDPELTYFRSELQINESIKTVIHILTIHNEVRLFIYIYIHGNS